ncbi:MAG: cysteine--tRNA ligase [archaeon]
MIKLYNTMSRKKEEFKPIGDVVGIYTCGPTVYYYAHIGNLRAYVFADTLKRVLLYNGFKAKHVMNITDVGHLTSDADEGEDKMEAAKRRERKSAWEIAKFYEKAFFEDTERLNIIKPDVIPRATEHIAEQIELIKSIEKNGFAYVIEDGVYFDTSRMKDYGKLARLKIDELKAGARVEMTEGKKNPTDFALWKFSPKNAKRDMEWDSPWGKGFPGWHIECSAMSMKYLGKTFDIHTGGVDHIPVHHTNEIAQSVAANGVEPVRYWMHNEFLSVKEGKMAKSKGDVITLSSLIEKGYSPMNYRYLLLTAHYRKQLAFTFEALDGAKSAMQRLKTIILEIKSTSGKIDVSYKKKFLAAVNNDLGTPEALAVMWEMLRDKNVKKEDKYATLVDFDRVLGLRVSEMKEEELAVSEEVNELVKQREEARKKKDYRRSDELRDKIKKLGYSVSDTPEGPKVKKL